MFDFFCKVTNYFSFEKKTCIFIQEKGVTFFNINSIKIYPRHQNYGIAQMEL